MAMYGDMTSQQGAMFRRLKSGALEKTNISPTRRHFFEDDLPFLQVGIWTTRSFFVLYIFETVIHRIPNPNNKSK